MVIVSLPPLPLQSRLAEGPVCPPLLPQIPEWMGTPRRALQGVAMGDRGTHRAPYVSHHPRLQEAVLWGGEEEWMLAGVASCGSVRPVSGCMCASQYH